MTQLKSHHLPLPRLSFLTPEWGANELSACGSVAGLVARGEQSVPCFPSYPLDLLKTREKMSIKFFKRRERKGLCRCKAILCICKCINWTYPLVLN